MPKIPSKFVFRKNTNQSVEEAVARQVGLMYDDVYSELTFIETINWTAVTFENSWVDYGSGLSTAAYCKDGMGFVHIRGLIKNGTLDLAAFTLPEGYRPPAILSFSSIQYDGSDRVAAITNILTDGKVTPSGPDNREHRLDGITFYAG